MAALFSCAAAAAADDVVGLAIHQLVTRGMRGAYGALTTTGAAVPPRTVSDPLGEAPEVGALSMIAVGDRVPEGEPEAAAGSLTTTGASVTAALELDEEDPAGDVGSFTTTGEPVIWVSAPDAEGSNAADEDGEEETLSVGSAVFYTHQHGQPPGGASE